MIPLLALPILKRLPWKLIGVVVAVVAVVWFAWAKIDAYGDRREATGEARIQALWAQETAEAVKVAQAAETARIASESATAARNAELEKRHAEERAVAIADRDRYRGLFQRAREAAAAASGGIDAAPTGQPGIDAAPEAGSPEAARIAAEYAAALDQAVADVMVESRQNASQLLRLQDEIRPQLQD